MIVTVSHYDDVFNNQGDLVTIYYIVVKFSKTSSFSLTKRYSDFAHLYSIVKDRLPLDYKFPNKSLFNNNAQFTKDRRLRGFDELMKVMSNLESVSMDLRNFIEWNKHVEEKLIADKLQAHDDLDFENNPSNNITPQDSGKDIFGSYGQVNTNTLEKKEGNGFFFSNPQKQRDFQPEEIIIRKKLSTLMTYLLQFYPQLHENNTMRSMDPDEELSYRRNILRMELFHVLKVVLPSYGLLVIFGLIDISHSTLIELILTIVAMVILVFLLKMKHQQSV